MSKCEKITKCYLQTSSTTGFVHTDEFCNVESGEVVYVVKDSDPDVIWKGTPVDAAIGLRRLDVHLHCCQLANVDLHEPFNLFNYTCHIIPAQMLRHVTGWVRSVVCGNDGDSCGLLWMLSVCLSFTLSMYKIVLQDRIWIDISPSCPKFHFAFLLYSVFRWKVQKFFFGLYCLQGFCQWWLFNACVRCWIEARQDDPRLHEDT